MDDPGGGPPSDNTRAVTQPEDPVPRNLEPSKWKDVETVTIDVVEDQDSDDYEDEDEEEGGDIEMMEIAEMNNNISRSVSSNGNNNVEDGESEHTASTSEEALLSASTISTASR